MTSTIASSTVVVVNDGVGVVLLLLKLSSVYCLCCRDGGITIADGIGVTVGPGQRASFIISMVVFVVVCGGVFIVSAVVFVW